MLREGILKENIDGEALDVGALTGCSAGPRSAAS
jgi:hypothetical protein